MRGVFVRLDDICVLLDNAAQFTKIGRGTIKNKVGATLQIPPGNYTLLNRFVPEEDELDRDENKPVFLHVISVKNPATKARNLRYRIAANIGWELKFLMMWDPRIVSVDLMKGVIEDGGILEGFMDGRNIGYGRFEVIDINIFK